MPVTDVAVSIYQAVQQGSPRQVPVLPPQPRRWGDTDVARQILDKRC
jgi:hypothetical protein